MESEDKQRIDHPPGHENHGVHVCHKCGWAFPNPHPSAKQRRAHKKVCGKIAGLKIAGSEEKFHSDSDSDEANKHSGLGDKVSETVPGSSRRSEGEVFVDAIAEFGDAESHHTKEGVVISDKIPHPNDSTKDDQIQKLHALECEPDQLGSGIHLEDQVLQFTTDPTVASTSDKKTDAAVEETQLSSSGNLLSSSSPPLEPTVLTNDSLENSSFSFGDDVNSSVAVVGTDMDAVVNGVSTEDKVLPPAILRATEVEYSETNTSTLMTRDESFKDTVMDFNVPDSTISHAHEEQCNVSGQQKDQSERSSIMQLDRVEAEAGEHLGVSIDTHRDPKASLHNDSGAEVYETKAENFPAFSILEVVPARNITEMKSDAYRDHRPLNPEASQTLASVEDVEINSQCSHPVLEESHSGSTSIKSDESADRDPKASLHNDSGAEVYETKAENFPAFPILEVIPARNITEMKSDAYRDHRPLNPEVSQTLASVEDVEINSQCSHPVLEESHSGSTSIKSDESADVFPTTVQMQEVNYQVDGPSCIHISKELIVDQSGVEDLNGEASQYLGTSSTECAPEEIYSNGLGTNSDSTKAFIPDDPVMGLNEADAAQSCSQDTKRGSLGDGKFHEGFAQEVLPEAPVVPVAGGGDAVSSAATDVHQEIAKGSGKCDVYEESVSVHSSVVREYGEAQTENENSLSSILVTRECAINATEGKPQMHENAGRIEVEGNLQLTEATDTSVIVESKGIDIDSCPLESVSNNDRQSCHAEVDPESFKVNAPEEPVRLPVDPESFVQSSFAPAKSGTSHLMDGDDVYEGGGSILKQDASTSVLIADHSVDYVGQTDIVEGYCGFVSEPIAQGLRGKVSGTVAEGSNISQEEVFLDAVAEPSGPESHHVEKGVVVSDTIPQPNDSAHDNQIQNLHALDGKTDLLDSGITLQEHALHSIPDGTGASTSDMKTNMAVEQTASPLDQTAPINDSIENPNFSCGEDVSSSAAVVDPDTYAGSTGESTEAKVSSATAILPANEVVSLSDYTNVSTVTTGNGPSKDAVMDLEVPDSTISHAHEEQSNASGQQKDQSEMSCRLQSGLVEVEAADQFPEAEAADQFPEADSDCRADVYEAKAENLHAFSTLEIAPAMNTTVMNSDACEDDIAPKPEVTQTLTSIEVMESHSHCSYPILQESHSGSMPINSGESADLFAATVQKEEVNLPVDEHAIRSMSKELIVDQSGVVEDLNKESFQSLEISSHELVTKEIHFNGLGVLSDSTGSFTLDDVVMGLSQVDATHSQSKDNKLGSLGEEEPVHVFSHELLPEDPTVPVTGGSVTGSSAAPELHLEIAKDNGGADVHADTGTVDTNVVEDHGEAGTEVGNSLPGMQVTSEYAIDATEMKPQIHGNDGENEELLSVEAESSVQSSFTPADNGSENLSHGDASEGGNTMLRKDAIPSVFIADTSVDSISQTDSVEGTWGSVSDGMVPSTRDASKELSVNNSKRQSLADNTDVFEAPSFMTLVEPNRGNNHNIQQSSAEIQSVQNLQRPSSTSQTGWFPSLTNIVNESQGRKKNEEIIAKVVNWSPGKPHTPLRSLLVDADQEGGKHMASTPAQDHRTLKSHEGPVPEVEGTPANTAVEVSSVPSAKEAIDTEWNSPARLPVIKREKRKARGYWAPFVCCYSVN